MESIDIGVVHKVRLQEEVGDPIFFWEYLSLFEKAPNKDLS